MPKKFKITKKTEEEAARSNNSFKYGTALGLDLAADVVREYAIQVFNKGSAHWDASRGLQLLAEELNRHARQEMEDPPICSTPGELKKRSKSCF